MHTQSSSALDVALIYPGTGQRVRMVGNADSPRWVAKDVCDALGIINSRDALSRLADDEKGVDPIYTLGGLQAAQTVTEAGLYRLIVDARPKRRIGEPEETVSERIAAIERFRRWIFHDVLPTIRKTGSYSLPAAATAAPLISPELRMRILEYGRWLFSLSGKVEDRNRVLLEDSYRNLLTDGTEGGLGFEQVTITTRCEELGFIEVSNSQAQRIGKLAARFYREQYGCDPVQHTQSVGGAMRLVNTYYRKDVVLIDRAIHIVMRPPALPASSTPSTEALSA